MNRADVTRALVILRVAYPNFYAKMADQDIEITVDLWSRVFANDDARVVTYALEKLITQHTGYPPDIAAVRRMIDDLTLAALDEPSDEELWRMLAAAAANGIYGCYDEFKRLPPILKRYLGVPEALRDYAQMSESAFQTVVKGQFLKQIPHLRERERFHSTTPQAVKNLLADASKNPFALPEG